MDRAVSAPLEAVTILTAVPAQQRRGMLLWGTGHLHGETRTPSKLVSPGLSAVGNRLMLDGFHEALV